jgi:IS605 OrfB family transposase
MAIWDDDIQNWDYISYRNNVLSGQELIKFRQKLLNMGMTEKEIEDEIYKHNQKLHQQQLNKNNIGEISGLELNKFRNTTEKQVREMNIASKWAGDGRRGHGYKTRMKPLEKLRGKVSNYADTFNHKYSRYIVDFALKNHCGVIQIEDLSGVTSNTHEKFLKDWSYYDLQQKIIYKAREYGIKAGVYKDNKGNVLESYMVNPYMTSKRCSKCGCIHIENRNCKENQAKFECKICGYGSDGKVNADVNAAKNIAIPHIDVIIQNTEVQGMTEEQGKEKKKTAGRRFCYNCPTRIEPVRPYSIAPPFKSTYQRVKSSIPRGK